MVTSHSASVVLEKFKLNIMQIQSLTMIRLHWLTKVHLLQKIGNPSLVYLFSSEKQVLRAEVLQALQVVDRNYSFASSENDNEKFKIMFPDAKIAQSYLQGKTKVRYNIQYGIAPHVKQMLIYDVNNTPFIFKFNESTTSQVKTQYAYLQFWSKNMMK